ncbi:thioredoxin-like protein [Obba rivulosa]|uniref:Thioredoxin-like protein n=1 Tax=Obba rivulosa TaxID=1052685 RepID=A0A8E2J4G3_9APHY|nr:thioredoxin-like protein [Obba rivulosa]
MQEPRTISLIILSDMMCPWCYIGQQELKRAIEAVADLPVSIQVEYRPYCLQPTLPVDGGLDKRQWLTAKFGGKMPEVESRVTTRAKELGIEINFDGIISHTLRAHRLCLKAWKLGGQTLQQNFLDALFVAYFTNGKNIGDPEVLGDLAEASGVMSKAETIDFLKTNECTEEVEHMMADARRKGVTGVPYTVIQNKYAAGGGLTSEVYIQIFKKLAQTEHTPSTPLSTPMTSLAVGPTCQS